MHSSAATYSTVDEYLGCFQFFVINKSGMVIHVQILCGQVLFFLSKYQGMEFLDHRENS
jgi:hypothetical protein